MTLNSALYNFCRNCMGKKHNAAGHTLYDDNPALCEQAVDITEHFQDFNQKIIEAHNYYRCLHVDVDPLYEKQELTNYAQSVSDTNAESGKLAHSQHSPYGENLYTMKWGSLSYHAKNITGLKVVKAWYDEIKDYSFQINGPVNDQPIGKW
ncbi:Golgi-associated plant pathogenesis-related protein 1-like [Anneissia japonica]|uniref:Golgi-associated plant pathogenesis-related protein 1-like n=1 Tax=Anneissia japonica TaxID=1529436 RepID=UPI0014258781|nr:Golgi-associated plant pathogenesis-related protein 1-like [Anneissia japonica]